MVLGRWTTAGRRRGRPRLGGLRRVAWGAAALAVALAVAPVEGHSGANAVRVEQRTILHLKRETVEVEHVLRLNRPAAFLEVTQMDANGDGQLTPEERKRYFKRVDRALANSLSVRLDGKAAELRSVGEVELEMPFTKRYRFEVDQPDGWKRGAVLELHNDSYLATTKRARIRVKSADAVRITHNSLSEKQPGGTAPMQRDVTLRYRASDEPSGETAAPEQKEGVTTAVQGTRVLGIALGGGVAVCLAAGGLYFRPRNVRIGAAIAATVCGATAGSWAAWPAEEARAAMAPAEAKRIFRDLHESVYDAFSAPSERALYDRLAKSLDGDLLHDVYGEIYPLLFGPSSDRGDSAEGGSADPERSADQAPPSGQGSLTAPGDLSIQRVRPVRTRIMQVEGGGQSLRVNHCWRVYGTVRHFSHSHPRFHEYEATYRVARREGDWRLVDMEVVAQRRILPEKAGLATLRPAMQRATAGGRQSMDAGSAGGDSRPRAESSSLAQ